MDITIDWSTAIPVLVATAGPTLMGFLQQLSERVSKAPWYLKSILNAIISAVTGALTAYIASGDAILAAAGGALVGVVGSMNIALRKGSRSNLEISITQNK